MKKSQTIGLAATMFAATVSTTTAGTYQHEPASSARPLSAHEILTTVRTLGFDPTPPAFHRGPYHVLHAYDQYGLVQPVKDSKP
jgi:hypothetical protein